MVNENTISTSFKEYSPQKIMEREQSENDENNPNKLNIPVSIEEPNQLLCDKDISTYVIKPLGSDDADVNNGASNNVSNITEGREKDVERINDSNQGTLSNKYYDTQNNKDSCFESGNNPVLNGEEISDSKEQSESVSKNNIIDSVDEEYESEVFGFNNRNKKTKISAILNSDSDSEQETSKPHSSPKPNEDIDIDDGPRKVPNKKLKRIAVIDSDSEDEAPEALRGIEAEPDDVLQNKEPSAEIFVVGNNGELIKENETHAKDQKRIWSNLCDPDSSEEESNKSCNENEDEDEHISDSELNSLQTNNVMDKKSRNRTKKKAHVNKNKEEKMTAKKALEERKKILAESQRRVRDSQVSLPYHKPKSRTLKEFLQNRPKLALSLSTTQVKSPVAAIKMSTEQLKIMSNKLKHREKEVEEFYKSDSEPENEENEEEIDGELNEQQEACSSVENIVSSEMSVELKNIQNESEAMELGTINIKSTDALIESVPDENIVSNLENHTNQQENCEDSDKNDSPLENETIDSSVHRNEVLKEISVDMEVDSSENTLLIHSEQSQTSEKLVLGEEKEYDSTKTHVSGAEDDGSNQSSLKANQPNPVSPEKGNKLTIISNVILQPSSNPNDENLYTIDAELSEFASEAKENNKRHSDNYEFNLDDIEEESQNIGTDNDVGLRKDKRKSEMVERLAHIKPRLSGAPNHLIDLENDEVIPDEVSRLRERFIQHNLKIGKHAHKQEISIVSVTDGEIHKETLALNINEDDDENLAPIEKPGVRLKKLRDELQLQMAQKRSELWKDKMNNVTKNEDDDEGEKSDCGMDDILDNEDEEELTESEDEDLEENDCDMSDKVKKKSAFVDEEADESDIEDNEEVNEKDLEEDEADLDDIEEQTEHGADVEDAEEQIEDETPKKKVLKRIVKPEESDDEEDYSVTRKNNLFDLLGNKLENYVKSDDQILSSCDPPANYKVREPLATPTNSGAEFLTPVTYMTGLKNLNTSALKFAGVADSPPVKTVSEGCDANSMQVADESELDSFDTKKASAPNYSESDILGTQDVLAICSGEFPSSLNTVSSPEISTQQLREIFTVSDSNVQTSGSDFNTQDLADICSGKFTGSPLDVKQKERQTLLDENDEHMISQLIDEEELERFKQKFVSPITNDTQKTIAPTEIEEVHGTGGVIDSEDEDEGLKLKKNKRKRLAFSDDESEGDVEEEEEEIVDLHDNDDPPNVEYDSEENEIDSEEEMLSREKRQGEIMKATEFFEKEAELSESEWGSEDEDEKNLDDMEFEKGDEEKFDDDELRTDIERIQMRQMLDEDNREVKLLQELLLEDGELHGSGRQRQFRWKNLGEGNNENGETKIDDDDIYLDDDEENEEQWRKSRHQRELFLMKKQTQMEENSLVMESQKLSFSYKPMKRISQTSKVSQTISVTSTNSPEVKQPFRLLNKRGSFLSRGEKILQKFAEATKVSLTTKTTNRIVFQAVEEVNIKKRKSLPESSTSSDTPIALKKLKLAGLSPAVKKERLKIGKSLFSDIVID